MNQNSNDQELLDYLNQLSPQEIQSRTIELAEMVVGYNLLPEDESFVRDAVVVTAFSKAILKLKNKDDVNSLATYGRFMFNLGRIHELDKTSN